jgi:hypothetical protein
VSYITGAPAVVDVVGPSARLTSHHISAREMVRGWMRLMRKSLHMHPSRPSTGWIKVLCGIVLRLRLDAVIPVSHYPIVGGRASF